MKRKLIIVLLVLFTLTSQVYAGEISVYINNQRTYFNSLPQIRNGATLVPMRDFFEELGAEVTWNQSSRMVTGTRGNTTVTLQIGSKVAVVNGKVLLLREPAQIMNDRTFIPLRFVGEALGEKVNWEASTKTIRISSNMPTSNTNTQENKVDEATSKELHSFETEVIKLVNQERSKQGLSPLKANIEVSKVARVKSEDMRDNNYFSHQSPIYGSPFDMMKKFNISYGSAGENIAAGQTTPQKVVEGWMNSPGHRANILNSNFTKIGVGYVNGGSYRHYWTQMFIGTK